uniref:Uncharacterized protein n=1 Tax=Ciona savignyi TaxID=51511 RepID=H2YJD0_CIOSA
NTKVPLQRGRSLMDWIRLSKSGVDLRGTGSKPLQISMEELKKHDKPNDAWIAIRGYVFNITRYIEYHPGGESELMRGAGKDATSLFEEVHRWVNFESMLKSTFIGTLIQELPSRTIKKTPSSLTVPVGNLARTSNMISQFRNVLQLFQTDFRQNEDTICLHVDIVSITSNLSYTINLLHQVENTISVEKNQSIEIILKKSKRGLNWDNFGFLMQNRSFQTKFRPCTLVSKSNVTHDTLLLHFRFPDSTHMIPPIGAHVFFQTNVDGVVIRRPYTVAMPSITDGGYKIDSKNFYAVIKVYSTGALSNVFVNLNPGSEIPVGTYEMKFHLEMISSFKQVFMLAAGTGFTPMIRILHHCLFKTDKKVKLGLFNKQQRDILWKNDFETL